MRINKPFVVLVLALTLAACGGGSEATTPFAQIEYTYTIPDSTGDGWTTGHIDDHGFIHSFVTHQYGRFTATQRGDLIILHGGHFSVAA